MPKASAAREQLERIERQVEKHHRYYVRMWKRAQVRIESNGKQCAACVT